MASSSLRRNLDSIPPRVLQIQQAIAPLREEIRNHPLYRSLRNADQVRVFLEHHVYAVWDFMSLLKSLQVELTRVRPPWQPIGDGLVRRFINELVLEEEYDQIGERYISHLELYREAMQQAGADIHALDCLLQHCDSEAHPWKSCPAPSAAQIFVAQTWQWIEHGSLAARAAAFTFGREDMIPAMFKEIVDQVNAEHPGIFDTFLVYLERHIELDGDSHGPMAYHLLDVVCGEDEQAWTDAEAAAREALHARKQLWDALYTQIQQAQQAAA